MHAARRRRRATGGVLKRALAPLTWWAIGIGYVLAVAVIVLPVDWLGTAAYLCAALSLVGATFVAARVHRVNRRFVAAVSAIGGFFAASQIVDSLGDTSGPTRGSPTCSACSDRSASSSRWSTCSAVRASANIRSVHRRRADRRPRQLADQLGGADRARAPEPRRLARSTRSSPAPTNRREPWCCSCSCCCCSPVPAPDRPSVWLVTVAMAFNLGGDVLWGLATRRSPR